MPRTDIDAEQLHEALAERDRRIADLQAELLRTRAEHARRLRKIRTNIDGLAQALARGEAFGDARPPPFDGARQLRLVVGGRS